MHRHKNLVSLLLVGVVLPVAAGSLFGQAAGPETMPAPVTFTTQEDHRNMLDQLGITKLRPGPNGNESAPNHANYDEALANPYPDLPPVLVLNDGKKVTTAKQWREQRRPQIVEAMSREVYGFVPQDVPKVTWAVVASERETVGGIAVIAKQLVGHVDNSSYPLIDVNLSMTLVTPADVKTPVPILMMFRRTGLPSPAQPPQGDVDRLNQTLKAMLESRVPEVAAVFKQYPGYSLVPAPAPPRL